VLTFSVYLQDARIELKADESSWKL